MRWPAVAARGIIITMKPSMRTGICTSATKNSSLVRPPAERLPLTTSIPPTQTVAIMAPIQRAVISG